MSPSSQLESAQVLSEMSRTNDAQFIISTHSPILMSCGTTVYNFDIHGIKSISYKDTGHYRIYKDFFQKHSG